MVARSGASATHRSRFAPDIMTKLPRHISKSRFCVGLQCLRRLWWDVNEPEAPELESDPSRQVLFDRGRRVGELAREYFAGGILVAFEPWEVAERVAATEAALKGSARAVFEASFAAGGIFAAVDVLEKRKRGWALVEVKATLEVKEQFLPDVAVQLHAARAAGVDIRRAELMHLNRDCTYPNLDDLFVREDVTNAVEPLLPRIPCQLETMRTAHEGNRPPDVVPGDHCSSPYECSFLARCHPKLPEHHVSTIYRLSPRRCAEFERSGYRTIHDLPEDIALPSTAARQVRAVKSGKPVVEAGLAEALKVLEHPVAFLDFETINPPVPVWNGCHPYEQIPVQMSCHAALDHDGRAEHHEHLAEGNGDPRPALAEAVIRACRGARTVGAYNSSFEARCLEHLASAVPGLKGPLDSIRERLQDLLPIVRDHVYHPEFGGGFGLKSVLPSLVPGLGYGDLEVSDGNTASALLESLLLQPDAMTFEERKAARRNLLAYCERDTEALVRLSERLEALARSAAMT